MVPFSLLQIAPYVAALRIVVATLPNGDVEQTLLTEVPGGVRAVVERRPARSDAIVRRKILVPQGRYGWQIVEEKRTVLMAVPGRPTGVVARAFGLILTNDQRPQGSVSPNPVEAFRFYAPTREAAEAMRDRLKVELRP